MSLFLAMANPTFAATEARISPERRLPAVRLSASFVVSDPASTEKAPGLAAAPAWIRRRLILSSAFDVLLADDAGVPEAVATSASLSCFLPKRDRAATMLRSDSPFESPLSLIDDDASKPNDVGDGFAAEVLGGL